MSVLVFREVAVGDKGSELVEKLKYNFDLLASYADTTTQALIKRIISEQIEAIKLEGGKLYYTQDYNVETPVWTDMSPSWGSIIGDLSTQTDLMDLLNSKVSTVTFNLLDDRVEAVENSNELMLVEIGELQDSLEEINGENGTLSSILSRITVAEQTLLKKITSNQIVEIRQTSANAPLQYTIDGVNWINVTGSQFATAWGNIGGDIDNQLDLKVKFDNINEEIDGIQDEVITISNTLTTINTTLSSLSTNLQTHSNDKTNPHEVTKEQIGLDEVDNTSDANKPLSTEQKEYIDQEVTTLNDTITQHKTNADNPHSVTKSQIGLGNVDNTADINKPISNPQKAYIEDVVDGMVEAAMEQNQSVWLGTMSEYTILVQNDEVDENCLYVTK